ncbi:hypothetical protein [Sodalis-like endosymbiont of Proechinophthirus fluctus]|uniref:hypothetical protein n=1 Tax=Sodalis-like endosymbiont of Proechinophthirus fluctus TaxID=1462730 RepID=UPI00082F9A95|nr:hypothetical protein [Sodalis-like endosymbiont of Proechinophthirus fluctus]
MSYLSASSTAANSSRLCWRSRSAVGCRLFADEIRPATLDLATGDRIADQLFNLNQDFVTALILITHGWLVKEVA